VIVVVALSSVVFPTAVAFVAPRPRALTSPGLLSMLASVVRLDSCLQDQSGPLESHFFRHLAFALQGHPELPGAGRHVLAGRVVLRQPELCRRKLPGKSSLSNTYLTLAAGRSV
jgi:hypothetical protein